MKAVRRLRVSHEGLFRFGCLPDTQNDAFETAPGNVPSHPFSLFS
jgi:hypothetical protein